MIRLTELHVREFMEPAKIIKRDTNIGEAIGMLSRVEVDVLSVVNDKNELIGSVNEMSFIKLIRKDLPSTIEEPVWYNEIEKSQKSMPVDIIMSSPITIKASDNVESALKTMNANRVRALHVVDDGNKVLGIVSMGHIFKSLLGD